MRLIDLFETRLPITDKDKLIEQLVYDAYNGYTDSYGISHCHAYIHHEPDPIDEYYERDTGNKWNSETQECVDYLKHVFFNNQIDGVWNLINSKIVMNEIKLYRVIGIKQNEQYDHSRHAGIYWTHDPDSDMDIFWADHNIKHNISLITAHVPISSIDWFETFRSHCNPQQYSEMEVRLFKNSPIDIMSIEHNQ